MSIVLVTGAAGNVASRVIRRLVERKVAVRALVRSSDRKPAQAGVELFEADLADRGRVRAAMRGVSKVYLLATGLDLVELEANVTLAAVDEKVERIVKHSVMGAQHEATLIPRNHRASEKRIEASGLPFTFLRPTSFASNVVGWAGMLKAGDAVYGPFGEMALPVIDPEDIAAVAEKALLEPGHEGKAYELTGPEAVTAIQQVATLGAVLHRTLRYVNVPDDAARKGMVDGGMPPAYADAMIDLVKTLRGLGRIPPTSTVEELLGRAPASFADFAKASAAVFR
jgi:uncharacterized protein YbjT (DUF2867 family)